MSGTNILDVPAHTTTLEDDNRQIINLLKQVVYLLEIATSQEMGSTQQVIED